MPDLRVRLPGSYPFLLAAIIQRIDWHLKYDNVEEKLSIRDKEITNPETLKYISETVKNFLETNIYSRDTVEQYFDIKIVNFKYRPARKVSLIPTLIP